MTVESNVINNLTAHNIMLTSDFMKEPNWVSASIILSTVEPMICVLIEQFGLAVNTKEYMVVKSNAIDDLVVLNTVLVYLQFFFSLCTCNIQVHYQKPSFGAYNDTEHK